MENTSEPHHHSHPIRPCLHFRPIARRRCTWRLRNTRHKCVLGHAPSPRARKNKGLFDKTPPLWLGFMQRPRRLVARVCRLFSDAQQKTRTHSSVQTVVRSRRASCTHCLRVSLAVKNNRPQTIGFYPPLQDNFYYACNVRRLKANFFELFYSVQIGGDISKCTHYTIYIYINRPECIILSGLCLLIIDDKRAMSCVYEIKHVWLVIIYALPSLPSYLCRPPTEICHQQL